MTTIDETEWRGLAANAFLPAPFASPAWAAPVIRFFPAQRLSLAKAPGGALAGVVLTQWRALPWPMRRSTLTPLTFGGPPLLERDTAPWALREIVGRTPLLMRGVAAEGPFWQSVRQSGLRAGIVTGWRRAALNTEGDFGRWFEGNFNGKRRKEYRRLRSRLGEAGRLESLAWEAGTPIDPWTEEFLVLESKGWKGRRGTALGSDPRTADNLRQALRSLGAEGSLRFWKLALDERPIGMLFATVMGGQAWLGKIAHDEDFAKYSPGVLTVLDATQSMMADPAIRFADSCAQPDHPMIDHIWRERLAMADILLAPAGFPAFDALLAAERGRARARAAARHLFHLALGRKVS